MYNKQLKKCFFYEKRYKKEIPAFSINKKSLHVLKNLGEKLIDCLIKNHLILVENWEEKPNKR